MQQKTVYIVGLLLLVFGIIENSLAAGQPLRQTVSDSVTEAPPGLDLFPILMYDSDIGVGFGGKAVLKDYFRRRESFDITLFASTKGEQWYALRVSLPDYELRQGLKYSLAVDFKMEWNKILKSNFFGIGNHAEDNDFQFPRESLKLEITGGHAFTPAIIGELSYRFTHFSVYDFDPAWGTISASTPGAVENHVSIISLALRLDSRDSKIHPHRGVRLFLKSDYSHPRLGSHWKFTRYRLELSGYQSFLSTRNILALRFWTQQINGRAPFQELSTIGGGWTARGYKAGRFLDRVMVLTSLEYRLAIYQSLGGVLFGDAGRVGRKLSSLSILDWHANWGWGLRYYLANFVVRFDMGFSKEGTRIFFNFGQVF